MNRTILQHPDYSIDSDGVVRITKTGKTVAPFACEQANGVIYLAVSLEGTRYLIWRLLSIFHHSGRLLLPRDGCFLNWRGENVFELVKVSSARIADGRHIHKIWHSYQRDGFACWQLAEKTGLHQYAVEEFRTLIQDILIASVR